LTEPGHRFDETFEHLAGTTTMCDRFVCAAGDAVVTIDVVARYEHCDGVTAVSSCDIHEFADNKIAAITSYAVEVDVSSAGTSAGRR
jgi:hypothetical protein